MRFRTLPADASHARVVLEGRARHRAESERVDTTTENGGPPHRQPLTLLTLAYEEMAGNVLWNDTFDTAADKCGKNIGNLVWLYAATNLILDRDQNNLTTPSKLRGAQPDVLITPSANIMWNLTDLLKSEARGQPMLASFQSLRPANSSAALAPRFIMGMGVKGYESIAASASDSKHPGDLGDVLSRELAPTDYVLHEDYVATLRLIVRDGGAISVRGAFTEAVLRNHGIKEAVALGCPSLFLNPAVDMGEMLRRKIEALGPQSKIAINMPQRWVPRLMTFLLRLALSSDNFSIIWQSPTDYWFNHRGDWDLKIKVPPERIHWFRDYESWSAFVCKHDAIIGSRIHGNMIGVGCPIPMLLIASDIRTYEMARSMHIPLLLTNHTMFQELRPSLDIKGPVGDADRPLPTVKRMFELANFNGVAFDRNRYAQAARYEQILTGLDLRPSRTIASLAAMYDG